MTTMTEILERTRSQYDRPMAAPGLTSYRIAGRFGWIMIGARDHEDAWREAQRSSPSLNRADLEIWNGTAYEPAVVSNEPPRSAPLKRKRSRARR